MISPSQLACRGVGIKPAKDLTKHAGDKVPCMMCGAPIAKGDPVDTAPKFGANFVDWPSMAAPTSEVICWGCHEVKKVDRGMLQAGAKAVYTANAAFKAHSREEQAYHLYNPPAEPFIFVQGIATSEHIVWKTPVALDQDRFPVRVGTHLLTINRKPVLAALEIWKAAVTAVQANPHFPNTQQLCDIMDPDLRDAGHMHIKGSIRQLELPEVAQLEKALIGLGFGDHWALSILVLYHNRFGYDAHPAEPARLFG